MNNPVYAVYTGYHFVTFNGTKQCLRIGVSDLKEHILWNETFSFHNHIFRDLGAYVIFSNETLYFLIYQSICSFLFFIPCTKVLRYLCLKQYVTYIYTVHCSYKILNNDFMLTQALS